MKRLFLLATVLLLSLSSCTENSRAKAWGGDATLDVPCGQMVGNITWKDDQLWYSTTPMPEGYVPQTHILREESSFGMMEGTYTLKESRCK